MIERKGAGRLGGPTAKAGLTELSTRDLREVFAVEGAVGE